MNSAENLSRTIDSNLSEEKEILPIDVENTKASEYLEKPSEQNKNPEEKKETTSEKARRMISSLKERIEDYSKESGLTFEKMVGKGVIGFAVVSALMSYPQFDAMAAAEDSTIRSESTLGSAKKGPEGIADETTERLNKEFADFANADLAKRKAFAREGTRYNENNSENNPAEKLKKGAIIATIKMVYKMSDEDATDFYNKNKEELTAGINKIVSENEKTSSSIDVLPEGGIMVSFNGKIENIGEVPETFINNLKEIKAHPAKYIAGQLLNLVVSGPQKSAESLIDKHTEKQNEYNQY